VNDLPPGDRLTVSPSPHVHSGASVPGIMREVLIALLPSFAASCWFFGWDAPRLVAVCVATCVLTEALCRHAMGRTASLGDLSAIVTGVLLAFNLPPGLPGWMAAAGAVFAIALGKQVYGGLGYNPFNPALLGRAFLLVSFTGAMTAWTSSAWPGVADAVTTATPLGAAKEALRAGRPIPYAADAAMLWRFFLGDMNGSLGETSAAAILLGGVYLLARRVISWHVPAAFLATVALYAAVLHLSAPQTSLPAAVHLLTGGLMLGAWFMATDMVTTPVTAPGLLIFGAGCGVLTMVIRTVKSGDYPEGVCFAILIMNAFTPLINRATRPRIFGRRPGRGQP
jgi:electron transport complex protein RnfD